MIDLQSNANRNNCRIFWKRKHLQISWCLLFSFEDIDFLPSSATLSKGHFGYQIRFDICKNRKIETVFLIILSWQTNHNVNVYFISSVKYWNNFPIKCMFLFLKNCFFCYCKSINYVILWSLNYHLIDLSMKGARVLRKRI